VFIFRISKIRL